jgi:hypothetical protein
MYDAPSNSVFTATGDALPGGRNRGANFTESAGYAEHVVQLDLDMHLKASHSPVNYRVVKDNDFSGTPIPVRASGCPAMVVAENKNGFLYTYRLNDIGAGVYRKIQLTKHLNGQPAWSPATRSVYVAGQTAFYRVSVTAAPGCALKLAWSVPLPTASTNGPPLVAGNVVWCAVSEDQTVWAIDAVTGQQLTRLSAGESVFAPISPVDGRVYVGGFLGLLSAYG